LPAVGVGTLLLVAGCGGDVDTDKAEKEIKNGLAAQTKGNVKYVKCPGGVRAQKGGTFQCEALIPVNVTQIDDNGNIRWQITSFVGPPAGATGATGPTSPLGASGATGPTGALPGSRPGAPAGPGAPADTNRFVTFKNSSQGYSIARPVAWTQTGSGRDVNFAFTGGGILSRFAHVIVAKAPGLPTVAELRKNLKTQQGVTKIESVSETKVNGVPAITATFTYTNPAAPRKRGSVQVIRRYVFSRGGKRIVLELGATKALVNKPALKKKFDRILKSFHFLT
jgi:hypothetical protein